MMFPLPEALSFDDVLLIPNASDVMPSDVDLTCQISSGISLHMPILSAAMDTVTESAMGIAMAQEGGLGVIHRNLPPAIQVREVQKVKRFESGIVYSPITIGPQNSLQDALNLMRDHRISGIPVVEGQEAEKPGRLVGILTNRDVRFATDFTQRVADLMTHEKLVTVREDVTRAQALNLFHTHRIEKLLVVDSDNRCIGLLTVKDFEKARLHPHSSKDAKGRLRAAAAIGTGPAEIDRAHDLLAAEVDVLVIDTAHGHSAKVIEQVRAVRALSEQVTIIAGNIATPQAALDLIEAGANAVKVGIGPGSICTTRIVAGVGVPQFTAICQVAAVCKPLGIPVVADGGIKYSGDIAKAMAAGANCVMIGSLLAGTDESPGDVVLYQGRSYKNYRGMGSLGAMSKGSAERYFQKNGMDPGKLIPEGIEGRTPYRGAVGQVLHQLRGGVRAAMGYLGAANIPALQANAKFVRITGAGLRESHVHDVEITIEPPNYRTAG